MLLLNSILNAHFTIFTSSESEEREQTVPSSLLACLFKFISVMLGPDVSGICADTNIFLATLLLISVLKLNEMKSTELHDVH